MSDIDRAVPIVNKWPKELEDLARNDIVVVTWYDAYRLGTLPLQDCLVGCIRSLARVNKELMRDRLIKLQESVLSDVDLQ